MARDEIDPNPGTERLPPTHWSDIIVAADPGHPECRQKLERLLEMYWKPVFAYIRVAWQKSIEDAQDLTQAFFTEFLEKNYIANLRPERGSFRGYLKRALKHFLIDAQRAEAVRRPPKPVFRLNATSVELDRMGPASPEDTPDQAYERVWFRTLLVDTIEELKRKLAAEGKSRYFDVFDAYCLDASPDKPASGSTLLLEAASREAPTYKDLAQRLGLSESDVRNYLAHCRRELRHLLERRIRGYVLSENEVQTELEAAAET